MKRYEHIHKLGCSSKSTSFFAVDVNLVIDRILGWRHSGASTVVGAAWKKSGVSETGASIRAALSGHASVDADFFSLLRACFVRDSGHPSARCDRVLFTLCKCIFYRNLVWMRQINPEGTVGGLEQLGAQFQTTTALYHFSCCYPYFHAAYDRSYGANH